MLYRIFSSIRTSVYILAVMCLFFLAGTIFPQGEKIEDYVKAGGKYIVLVRALDLLDIYSSPLFLAVVLLLLLNLSLCLYDRLKLFLRSRRTPPDFQTLKKHPLVVMFHDKNTGNRLRQAGFRLKSETTGSTGPGVSIYEKGIPYWWLSWFYHVGIILAIAGFFITALFAFEKDVVLYPEKTETISLSSRDTRWNRMRQWIGSGAADAAEADAYQLSLTAFSTEYYQGLNVDYPKDRLKRLKVGLGLIRLTPSESGFSYMPKMWRTILEVRKPDGDILDAEIRVNKPFRSGTLTLYQMGYEQKVQLSVNGQPRELEARVPFSVEGFAGKFVTGTVRTGRLFRKDGTEEQISLQTELYFIPEDTSLPKEELGQLLLDSPLEAKQAVFVMTGLVEGSYLSYRKDPGVWVVGFACLFVFVGLILRSMGGFYRVQCAFEKKDAYVLISSRGILADRDRIVRRLSR